jgi:hypothetical protein
VASVALVQNHTSLFLIGPYFFETDPGFVISHKEQALWGSPDLSRIYESQSETAKTHVCRMSRPLQQSAQALWPNIRVPVAMRWLTELSILSSAQNTRAQLVWNSLVSSA